MARGRGELTPKDIEIRKIISNNINKLLIRHNKKQTDIHNATGIPKSTLTGYIKGTSTPNQGNIQKISDFFGVKKSDIDPRFSSDLKKHNEKNIDINSIYSQLSRPRQKKVYNFANQELEEQKQEQAKDAKIPVIPIENNKKGSNEIYTFAAHSDDPNKTYTDEEISEIEAFLDQIKADYDKKHNK
ncbi:helix-turn-helix domain-containing protein [Enterococcus mundtii]|uniref:helix-turn-helix domain-containing protein n=1 Tax=Enterococcus mundtii TaxID=53346 RepID=UPI000DFD1060|nr:helix-turn-helix transcriptional regulator [Enterococcus mundtii]STD25461.1 phage repressor protein [Enterococcus mundtii]